MDERLHSIERLHGVFLTREARDLGYDDRSIKAALHSHRWHRVRHGAYCLGETWASASPERRHLIRAFAVLRTTPGPVALSHTTALLLHGVAVWGADLSVVHVTRLDGHSGCRRSDVVHHDGVLRADDVVEVDGVLATVVARAVLEAGTVQPAESCMCSADSALHLEKATRLDIENRYETLKHWPHAQRLQLVMRLMDGRAASVGESRSRYMFWGHSLPAPELQFDVYDEQGRLVGTTDFAWPKHRTLGEFDGRVKYGRLLKPGQQPGDAVFAEKRREDRLREVSGFGVQRLVWADLDTPRATVARFARHLGVVVA
jgi:hypothetical protein